MKVYPIREPLEGERVVGVDPAIENYSTRDWRRRVNSFPGRALSHMALTADQVWRSGHIAAFGTLVSPGVIDGFEVSIYGDTANLQDGRIHISTGKAISNRGEVLSLTRQLKVSLKNIFVFRHETHIAGDDEAASTRFSRAERLRTFGELIADRVELSRALVLVMEPVITEINVEYDAADPCAQDVDLYAFENWQQMDAFRLVFYTWPDNWIGLPARDEQWRNVLASNIFQKERELAANEYHPWEMAGVPIGLFGFDNDWNLEFIDRNAVTRRGGRRRRTSSVISDVGNRFLWQAQFQQFNEHLAEVVAENKEKPIEEIIKAAESGIRYFPPVGVIPKQFAELRQAEQSFFPVQYLVETLAVPYEQLDLVIRESAPLLPMDASIADRVQILAPVPQQYYEPDLLRVAEIDVEFDETIRRFNAERDAWLGRRLDLRRKRHWLNRSLKPIQDPEPEREYLKPDPNALDNLEMPAPYVQALVEIGDVWRIFKPRLHKFPKDWMKPGFNDSGDEWLSLNMGIGYGAGEFESELEDMPGNYVSVLCRKEFDVAAEQLDGKFFFEVTTDAGFRVFLNGKPVDKYNFNESSDAGTTSWRVQKHAAVRVVEIDNGFVEGVNLLAIQVHNSDLFADDFVFMPRLTNKVFVENLTDDPGRNEKPYGTRLVKIDPGDGGDVEIELDEQIEPSYEIVSIEALKTFLDKPHFAVVAGDEAVKEGDDLEGLGLELYIEKLKRRINNTNDLINLGFARVQTEMYRVRQRVLGKEAATKLATIPVLADIATLDSAAATREQITNFADAVRLDAEVPNAGVFDFSAGIAPISFAAADLVAETALPPEAGTPGGARSGPGIAAAAISGPMLPMGGGTMAGSGQPQGSVGVPFPSPGIDIGGGGAGVGTVKPKVPHEPGGQPGQVLVEAKLAKQAEARYYDVDKAQKQVEEQDAIVGGFEELRTTTVGERLEAPLAVTTKLSAVAAKAEIIRQFLVTPDEGNDGIVFVENVLVPGFRDGTAEADDVSIADIRKADPDWLSQILRGDHDRNVVVKYEKNQDTGEYIRSVIDDSIGEGGYFNASIRALNNASALLRRIERRTHAYKAALARCQSTLTAVRSRIDEVDRRLSVVNGELAESRHDVSVARAMRAEEQARIDAVNARRDSILAEHVPFLVFRRPRLTEARMDLPVMTLNPEIADDALPACDIDDAETPQEIGAMVDTLREAPIKWFGIADQVLTRLDRVDNLQVTVQNAWSRAQMPAKVHPLLQSNFQTVNAIHQGIWKSLSASYQRIGNLRLKTAAIDVRNFQRYGWKQAARQAREVISFGDIIDGNHGRPDAAQLASREMRDISRITTCLYLRFGQVLPSIRLDWAERLSQFDEVGGLRDLFSLPRWEEIDYIDRTEMQLLVDALYQKIDDSIEDAREVISELVRVALLTASHAPVTKLIAGRVKEPVAVSVGNSIDVEADLTRVRVGMDVMIQSGLNTVARAVIDDIVAGKAKARILHTRKETVRIEQNSRIQIGEARNFGRARFPFDKILF